MLKVYSRKEECCGCTACMNICPKGAIAMKNDEEGFLYPEIDSKLCIDCGLCKKVCESKQKINRLGDIEVFAFKNSSQEIRNDSTSGGVFSAVANNLASMNGVVYGAAFNEQLKVKHKRAESKEEYSAFMGSKYVQSDLNNVFYQINKDLENGRTVLFTGTPCQNNGLHNYLRNKNTGADNLILVDFICHGVPSPLVFNDYLIYISKKRKHNVTGYKFRTKINGWATSRGYTPEITYDNGKSESKSDLSKVFTELFFSNLCLRPSCHNCHFANRESPSDMTIGDYWGIEKHHPEFKDELGVSVVIINTIKGKAAFEQISKQHIVLPSTFEQCVDRQWNLQKPTQTNPKRGEFWVDYSNDGFKLILKKYANYTVKSRAKTRIIKILKKLGLYEIAINGKKKILG